MSLLFGTRYKDFDDFDEEFDDYDEDDYCGIMSNHYEHALKEYRLESIESEENLIEEDN